MPKKLKVIPIAHSNDGHITLLINGKEYDYFCDNAIILSFIKILRKRTGNKGKALSIFKRKAKLL